METASKANISIPVLVVLYDFRYMWKDNREIAVKKGEKLFLLEKTNRDWWQVVRPTERKSFFVPAQYVEFLSKKKREEKEGPEEEFQTGFTVEDDSVLYENLDNLKQHNSFPGNLPRMCKGEVIGGRIEREKPLGDPSGRSKPVPKTRTKVTGSRRPDDSDDISENDSLRSYTSRTDKPDKSDKVNPIDKVKQDSLSKETGTGRSYRGGKGVGPVAVENLVYSKVPIVSDARNAKMKPSNYINKVNVDTGKNRMKNSYNLKTKVPATNLAESCERSQDSDRNQTRQCSSMAVRSNEKLLFSRNFSKSLEKLAEEIKFEPRKVSGGSSAKSSVLSDNQTGGKSTRPSKDLCPDNRKLEKRSKTSDASIVLDENKIQPQSRSVFSRFRRSLHHSNSFKSNNLKKLGKTAKKACELSLSWEGGLDKIQEKKENEDKHSVTPLGLQRSRTFMFPERSPLSVRPATKLFSGKHRLDTAYHSQRKPDEKVTLSTFKPMFNVDVTCEPRGERKVQEGQDVRLNRKDGEMERKEGSFGREENLRQKKRETETESKLAAKGSKNNVGHENVTKAYKSAVVPEMVPEYQVPDAGSEGLTLYSEPYCSNSESEDNLEEKSLAVIANKSLRSQSSIDSNLTVSEGTEASESDENSLEFALESPSQMIRQPVNKRRTSLVRNSRVESSKVRKVPARLPLTPPPDVKPMRDLGDGWGQYVSKGGRSFYYNVKTREKNWKPPRKTTPGHDSAFIGSFESVYSDANRSNTSSPLNENCYKANSLNRSNGSLSSKALNNNNNFETPKIGSSMTRWKEDSPDDLNRSSYNSSPVAGLSQSSGYSLNKSSRDSLNRFSPIDNIPSEEEGFELNDHVYKNGESVSGGRRKPEKEKEDEGRNRKESLDGSTFRIKPGWEEFYDEALDQIFYMYKDRKEREDLLEDILRCIRSELVDLEKRLVETMRTCGSSESWTCRKRLENSPITRWVPQRESNLFLAGKPPISPAKGQRRVKMNRKNRFATSGSRYWRKTNSAKGKGNSQKSVQWKAKQTTLDEGETNKGTSLQLSEQLETQEEVVAKNDGHLGNEDDDDDDYYEVHDKVEAKPLPFPMLNPELEYELNELLMMQRVTESSKTRRRMPSDSRSPFLAELNDGHEICMKDIPKVSVETRRNHRIESAASGVDMDDVMAKLSADAAEDPETRDKVKAFLLSKLTGKVKYKKGVKPSLKLREDVIIDWENDYENLNEPVVLEGKSLLSRYVSLGSQRRKRPSECESVSDHVNVQKDECVDECTILEGSKITGSSLDSVDSTSLKESDSELGCKAWTSSLGEGANSCSDLESDWTETTIAGSSRDTDNISSTWQPSDTSTNDLEAVEKTCPKLFKSELEHTFVSIDNNMKDELATLSDSECKSDETENGIWIGQRKTVSETHLIPDMNLESRSHSMTFFSDSLTEERSRWKAVPLKRDSMSSDICDWMAAIRGIEFPEDQLFSDNEWILSFDSEERAYFFEETSKKSLWALPDYSSENSKPDFSFPIQRSATESAINNEAGLPKLRQSKDGEKGSRVSGSARSSKTQSMLIEPKFDLSGNNGSKTYSMPRDLSKIFGEVVHVGVLNKTKILENGKKLRKNWTPSFVVLTESCLFFFKDAKSFQNMKNIVSPSNNHMCLSLQGAVIEKGDKISSRKNVYKISCSDNTDVLIQTEKSSEADDWFREINTIIQNLPQEPNTATGSPLLDLGSPSKVGRTKSLKVRSKETGSMEDLSSTPEDRQNKIKAKLRKFFIRRPTVDSLKKKGIWKDEPVFGCSLEQITKNRNPRVPVFVEKCIEFIESKEENMKTDGLYRASGNLSQVQKIRLEVDQNNLNIMKDEEDVHVLTGSLKLFFRELKEPLIPSKQLEPALLATDKQVRKERIKDFQKIVKSLPTPNYDTLKFLLQHLLRVKEYHKFNRMSINNLAIVFGPTLMWPEQESANMALEMMQQNVVIECLLKEFHEIFT